MEYIARTECIEDQIIYGRIVVSLEPYESYEFESNGERLTARQLRALADKLDGMAGRPFEGFVDYISDSAMDDGNANSKAAQNAAQEPTDPSAVWFDPPADGKIPSWVDPDWAINWRHRVSKKGLPCTARGLDWRNNAENWEWQTVYGWLPHVPGDDQPVDDDVIVSTRGVRGVHEGTRTAKEWRWSKIGAYDIHAYRIVK